MESISVLKKERKFTRQIISYASDITLPQVYAWMICLIFTRASFFVVLRPFAPAFYVSVCFTGISKVIAIISITVGNAIFSNVYETFRQLFSILFFEIIAHMVFKLSRRKETPFYRALLMSVLLALTGFIRGFIQGFRIYDLVVSLICGSLAFSLSVVMAPAAETFQSIRKKIMFGGKEIFAKAVILSVAVISLQDVILWDLQLGAVLAGLAVMMIARRRGSAVGALAGAILGMVVALCDLHSSMEIPGMLSLAGAAAGLRVKTKIACVTLWTTIIIFFSGLTILDGGLISKYYEALASGLIFFLIPKSFINAVSDELAGIKGNCEAMPVFDSGKTNEAADRMFVLSKALSKVSRGIEDSLLQESEEDNSVTQWIIETVAERVCNRCSLCERCWGTHFLKTYKLVEKSILDLKTDEAGQLEVPVWFKSICTKADKFIETLGSAYSVFKAENVWRTKLSESRLLLSKQMSIISSGVMSYARALMDTSERDYEVEAKLMSVANNRGIPVSGFRYHSQMDSKPYLEAVFEAKHKLSSTELDEIVQQNLQSTLMRVGECRRDLMGYSVVRYMKQPKYKTSTGVSRASRESSAVSGDNFAFFVSGEGFHISAVSDGTGSGKRAERSSRIAIQMFENLIEDGIGISLAIRLLNLYLNIRGEHDRVATMDICAIDLTSGEASFYKYGAAPSFIKSQAGVEIVNIENSDASPVSHYKPAAIKGGDFLIMLSDGVSDAFSDDGDPSSLKWFIEETETANAQQLADSILNEAKIKTKGGHDDMTVLVTRLW